MGQKKKDKGNQIIGARNEFFAAGAKAAGAKDKIPGEKRSKILKEDGWTRLDFFYILFFLSSAVSYG